MKIFGLMRAILPRQFLSFGKHVKTRFVDSAVATRRAQAALGFGLGLLALFGGTAVLAGQPLTFEERVKAQEAIERVYYAHRIWPKENPQPKPPFEQMMPAALIEKKAAEPLRMSAALKQFWNIEITVK